MTKYCLAVFASGTQAYEFYDILLRAGIDCRVTNAPSQSGAGCGVSVKFPYANLPYARRVADGRFPSFRGFYFLSR